jgi:hypothetical protein
MMSDGPTRKPDELDLEIEAWVAQNQTASDVMGVLIQHLADQWAQYHIPPSVVYVQLSVMAYLIRDQLMEAVRSGDVLLEQVEALDSFVIRMAKGGMEYQREMFQKLREVEEQATKPPAPVKSVPIDKMFQ